MSSAVLGSHGQIIAICDIPLDIGASQKKAKRSLKLLSQRIRRDHAQKMKPGTAANSTLRLPSRASRSQSPRKRYHTMPRMRLHSPKKSGGCACGLKAAGTRWRTA